MTRTEALAEARRRWGPSAKIWTWRRWRRVDGCHQSQRCVGTFDGREHDAKGATDWEPSHKAHERLTWEAAFLDADRRGGAR